MIESIPATIGKLAHLASLGLNRNKIAHLPSSIGSLSNLKSLQLSHNCLTSLPSEIGNLKSLETLNLMSNEIEEIPNEISGCVNLKTLQLDCNKLSYISQGILHLRLLQDLSVSRNKLEYVPFDVGFMDSIEEFTIDANKQLEFLPGSLLLSSGLKYLGVNGCERLEPPKLPAGDHKSKLAICAEMEWIGSESDNVIPFKEMCLRNIGNHVNKKDGAIQTFTGLPKCLIKTLQTPFASCTRCSKFIYRALFTLEERTTTILRHYQHPVMLKRLASIPTDALFIFIFCSLPCLQAFRREFGIFDQ